MKNGDLLGEGVCRSHLLPVTLQEAPLHASLRYPFSATPNLPEVLALALAGTGSPKDHRYLAYPD